MPAASGRVVTMSMIPLQVGVPLRDQLPPKPETPEPRKVPPALVDAVRAEMADLVQGDLEDPQALTRIEQFAQRARDLFAVVRGQPATASAYGGANVSMNGGLVTAYNVGNYQNPEQFGAKAIRELVSLLPELIAMNKKESPAEIAEAMKIAKDAGDEELHKALRDKLMGKPGKAAGVVEAKAEVVTTKAELDQLLLERGHEAHEDHEEHEEHDSEGSGPVPGERKRAGDEASNGAGKTNGAAPAPVVEAAAEASS